MEAASGPDYARPAVRFTQPDAASLQESCRGQPLEIASTAAPASRLTPLRIASRRFAAESQAIFFVLHTPSVRGCRR